MKSASIRWSNARYLTGFILAIAASTAAASPGDRSGIQVYRQICAQCHEIRVGPTITGRGLTLPIVAHFVRHGSNGMPAWRPTEITDTELARVAEWLRTPTAAPATASPPAEKSHGSQP